MLKGCENKRRWLGILFLALASGLLIWGQTVFHGRLEGRAGTAYHSVCLLFTGMAVLAGLSDIWRVRRLTRSHRRKLSHRMMAAIHEASAMRAP